MLSKEKYSHNKQQINNEKLQLSIRRAEPQDIDELSVMSRLCYPYLLRWQGPRFHNRKRWRALLDTESCEVWVCLSHKQIMGYFTLVLDRQKYDERENEPAPSLFVRLYMLGIVPKLFVAVTLKSLKRCFLKIRLQLFGVSSDDDNMAGSNNLREFDKFHGSDM